MSHLTAPLSPAELVQRVDSEGFVSAEIALDISDFIDGDVESVNDLISAAITGSEAGLTELGYSPIDVREGLIVLRVEGHVEFENLDHHTPSCDGPFETTVDLLRHLEQVHGVDPNTVDEGDEESTHEQIIDGDF